MNSFELVSSPKLQAQIEFANCVIHPHVEPRSLVLCIRIRLILVLVHDRLMDLHKHNNYKAPA